MLSPLMLKQCHFLNLSRHHYRSRCVILVAANFEEISLMRRKNRTHFEMHTFFLSSGVESGKGFFYTCY